MDSNPLFTAALGLESPWEVVSTTFAAESRRLDLRLDFKRGARFCCPDCNEDRCPVHDTTEKTWRHLDFFQHQAYLTARVPRVECPHCGVRLVSVPWARPGSGFTLLMEALILTLARDMPAKAVSRLVGVPDTRIWRVVEHYVGRAVKQIDAASVTDVGVDETSARKRHDYITLFFDLIGRRLLHAADGKDASTITSFATFLESHGSTPDAVREVSCDLSPAFQKGIAEELPNAAVTFDRFHVAKLLNDALDKVRRTEWRQDKTIKGMRYHVLRRPEDLSDSQRDQLQEALARNATLAKAYRLKETFRDLYAQPDKEAGHGFLKAWVVMAAESGIEPMVKVADSVRKHWKGILHWFDTGHNNGIMEGLNSLIQAAKRKARGYRKHRTFKIMAFLIAGKLDLKIA